MAAYKLYFKKPGGNYIFLLKKSLFYQKFS